MLSANFKPKRTAAASRGFFATARLSCSYKFSWWAPKAHVFWNRVRNGRSIIQCHPRSLPTGHKTFIKRLINVAYITFNKRVPGGWFWYQSKARNYALRNFLLVISSNFGLILSTLCLKKNRTPVTFSNNSNNPGSISTNFGTKNRQLIGA